MTVSDSGFTEVLVVLPTDSGHLFLEACNFVLKVLKLMLQNLQLSRLLAHQFRQLIRLENPLQFCLANQDIAKEAP